MTTTRKDPRPLLKPLTDLADRVSRTPINPRQRRALGFDVTVDAPTSGDPPPANLAPRPVPQPSDAATVLDFVQRRETVARYVRDAIAAAVDQQKENANRRTGTSTSLTWVTPIRSNFLPRCAFIPPFTSANCAATDPRLSPATLMLPAFMLRLYVARLLPMANATAELVIVLLQLLQAASHLIEALRDHNVLPTTTLLRFSVTARRPSWIVRGMSVISWKR
ncbi:hypothetical protein PC117_g25761 [Phytophthora cactorum]|uniref:Uncharacterized protein n=1 Tax=Phytophthora cactorum TaxID=29920 RepID=A0A8T1APY6_9STRA|nr:hypothetical protein PC117_g25761 [Phytophthora cactorum]